MGGGVSPLALQRGAPATIPLTWPTAGLVIVHLERGCFLNTAVIHTDVSECSLHDCFSRNTGHLSGLVKSVKAAGTKDQ